MGGIMIPTTEDLHHQPIMEGMQHMEVGSTEELIMQVVGLYT